MYGKYSNLMHSGIKSDDNVLHYDAWLINKRNHDITNSR